MLGHTVQHYTLTIFLVKDTKHIYNYLDNFDKEHHIESTNSEFNKDKRKDFPVIVPQSSQKMKKDCLIFMAKHLCPQ